MTSTTSASSAWDEIAKQLEQIQKPIRTFKLCKDADVRDRYLHAKQADAIAQQDLGQLPARGGDPDMRAVVQRQAKEAAAELADAQQAYDKHTVVLRFTALDRKDLEALMKLHPPTEENEERGEDFDIDTFAPALICAASMDGMPVEAAAKYLSTWPTSEATDLWQAAWGIQHIRRTDLGKG